MAKLIVAQLRANADILRKLGGRDMVAVDEWIDGVEACDHDSMNGTDEADLRDPTKRWKCMSCGVVGTDVELRTEYVPDDDIVTPPMTANYPGGV